MSTSFDPASIKTVPLSYTVFEILRRIERGDIELNPDFQRQFIWDEVRQSRLIESVLLGIPLPTFYLDKTSETRIQVVDGLQRLSTLHAFCKAKTLRLRGLEFLTELNGKTFDELSPQMQRTIEDTQPTQIAIEQGTPRNVKFMIFRRINTGGVNLNDQEIRHALFEGPARDFLHDLGQSEAFITATNDMVDSMRMEDRECVLRFLAFRLNPYDTVLQNDGPATFDELLNQTMDDLNNATPFMREHYAEDFRESMHKAHLIFEDLAFREVQEQQETGPFRKELFEVWSVLLCNYQLELIKSKPHRIKTQGRSRIQCSLSVSKRITDPRVISSKQRERHYQIIQSLPATFAQRIARAAIETTTNNAAFLVAIQGANDRQSIVTRFSTIDLLLHDILT